MKDRYVLFIAIGIIALILIVHILVKDKHPVKNTFYDIFIGLIAFAGVNLSGMITGVTLPVSIMSLGISAVAGIPGITMMLLFKIIFR